MPDRDLWDDEEWDEFSSDDSWLCLDCGIHTGLIDEYYMVNDDVWEEAEMDEDGMLCVGCLEVRLGRQLVPADFPDLPINAGGFAHSDRLMNRIGLD